jgi:type VI secretion system protein VasG
VLLNEVKKAHRDVLDLFYQVFDRGTMRDCEGREIDFRHCVILMTSNLGSAQIDGATLDNPAVSQAELLDAICPALSAHFQPALLARFQTLWSIGRSMRRRQGACAGNIKCISHSTMR